MILFSDDPDEINHSDVALLLNKDEDIELTCILVLEVLYIPLKSFQDIVNLKKI